MAVFNALRGVIKNECGGAIFAILGLLALFSVLTLGLYQKLQSPLQQTGKMRLEAEYRDFILSLKNKLEDPLFCHQMMNGVPFTSAAAVNPSASTLSTQQIGQAIWPNLYITNQSGAAVLTPSTSGMELRPGVVLNDIRLVYNPNNYIMSYRDIDGVLRQRRTFLDLPRTHPTYGQYFNNLFVKARIIVRSSTVPKAFWTNFADPLVITGRPNDEFQIPLYFYVNTNTNRVTSCFGPDSVASFCTLSGGAYYGGPPDPAYPVQTAPGNRCHPDKRCFMGTAGVLTDSDICNSPFTKTRVSGNPDQGIPGLFLCQWCNTSR